MNYVQSGFHFSYTAILILVTHERHPQVDTRHVVVFVACQCFVEGRPGLWVLTDLVVCTTEVGPNAFTKSVRCLVIGIRFGRASKVIHRVIRPACQKGGATILNGLFYLHPGAARYKDECSHRT